MRIDGMNKVSQLYKTNSSKSTTQGTKGSFQDSLEISQIGKGYQVAKQIVSQSPNIREDKVNDIKQRMEAGTYQVNSQMVAEKLVERFMTNQ